jgi:hypothetical protein
VAELDVMCKYKIQIEFLLGDLMMISPNTLKRPSTVLGLFNCNQQQNSLDNDHLKKNHDA